MAWPPGTKCGKKRSRINERMAISEPLPSITRMTLPMSVGVMSCPSTRLTRNTLSGFQAAC